MEQKQGDNICNYYILPLLRTNKHKFGTQNFVNCYLSEDRSQILVEVKRFEKVPMNYYKHEHYVTDFNQQGRVFIVYDVPEEFKEDVKLFEEGKYSQFSNDAKNRLYEFSSLVYKQVRGGKSITDERLLVLSRHPALRKRMEDRYNTRIEKDAELASVPNESNFIENEFNNRRNNKTEQNNPQKEEADKQSTN